MEDVEIRVQPRLLQQQAAAAYLGMSVQTFKNTVRPHVQAKKLSHKLIIFDRYDLDRWADSLKE